MFSFLYSEQKKMRQNAESWLEVADRVSKFRRDQLTEAQNQQLTTAIGTVKVRLKERADVSQLKLALERLEGVLRTTGGRIYPNSSLVENVEFFLVAAIVILGLRAYCVQPFKIPTNSMWPSYYGMTASEVYTESTEPSWFRKAVRMIGLGADHHAVKAPADGEVMLPVVASGYSIRPVVTEKSGRSMFIFPSQQREYTFMVDGQLAKLSIPAEFDNDFQGVLEQAFKGEKESFADVLRQGTRSKPLQSSSMQVGGRSVTVYWIPLGKQVKKGEPILSFDVLTGDLLFVDRLSYNFVQPKVGSGFVFKTENINSPNMQDFNGNQIRQYYIKRLVGTPGDTLEVRAPTLWRNGQPISGAAAFGKNARKEGLYPGYTAEGLLSEGGQVTVPAHSFFAMGDNSPRSKDARMWGFIPEKDVVGRPLFIYYPITTRWGPAK